MAPAALQARATAALRALDEQRLTCIALLRRSRFEQAAEALESLDHWSPGVPGWSTIWFDIIEKTHYALQPFRPAHRAALDDAAEADDVEANPTSYDAAIADLLALRAAMGQLIDDLIEWAGATQPEPGGPTSKPTGKAN